jgi:SAM-dependent methyltransferase
VFNPIWDPGLHALAWIHLHAIYERSQQAGPGLSGHATRLPGVRSVRRAAADHDSERAYLITRLEPKRGDSILDLGCGTGEDLERILQAHAGVRVVGMDIWEKMLRVARRRLSRHLKRGAAELIVGDAGERLPFPSKHFDSVFSSELLECLPAGKRIGLLREIHRVLKVGGRVLAAHTDWDTQVWNARDRTLERRLVHAFCDWTQGWMATSDGWMGRRLLGLFRQSNVFRHLEVDAYLLTNDRFKPDSYGYARAQDLLALATAKKGVRRGDATRFIRDLKSQDRLGAYFYSVTRYVVMGRRGVR